MWKPLFVQVGSVLLLASFAVAQCTTPWLPSVSTQLVDGPIHTVVRWDPDGPGPLPQRVVVGGQFANTKDGPASNIAAYDPATRTFTALGTGTNGRVDVLTVSSNGELLVGGDFTTAGGQSCSRIARWDGSAWTPFGSGLVARPLAIAQFPNGDLAASLASQLAAPISRWNGTSWTTVAAATNGSVFALAALPNGDLVAGGEFTSIGGLPVNYIASWNGTSWSAMGFGINTPVRSLAKDASGQVVAGSGLATPWGSGGGVWSWNGSAWSQVGGYGQFVEEVAFTPSGTLLAVAGSTLNQWSSSAWSLLTTTNGEISGTAALDSGDILICGEFVGTSRLLEWSNGQVTPVQPQLSGAAKCVAPLDDGGVAIGGTIFGLGGLTPPEVTVVRRFGSSLVSLGVVDFVVPTGFVSTVNALRRMGNGDLLAAGYFSRIDGVPANGVARWNGTTWQALGTGWTGVVEDAVVAQNGDVYIGGGGYIVAGQQTRILRWNGSAWQPIATNWTGTTEALALLPDGSLVAGGGLYIGRWNGSSWTPLGNLGTGWIHAMHVRQNGDLIVGGSFQSINGVPCDNIARWNGSTWSPLGTGIAGNVQTICGTPDDGVVVGGAFSSAGGVAASCIARWDGTSWSPFGSGTNGNVAGLAFAPNGILHATGSFTTAGGAANLNYASLGSSCPATVTEVAVTCPSGASQLSATTLPWVGSTVRTRTTGLSGTGLLVAILGFNPSAVALNQLVPQGDPLCMLRTTPDVLAILPGSGTSVDLQWSIPNVPTLVGAVVYQQMAPVALDVQGNPTTITTSNALQFVAGRF